MAEYFGAATVANKFHLKAPGLCLSTPYLWKSIEYFEKNPQPQAISLPPPAPTPAPTPSGSPEAPAEGKQAASDDREKKKDDAPAATPEPAAATAAKISSVVVLGFFLLVCVLLAAVGWWTGAHAALLAWVYGIDGGVAGQDAPDADGAADPEPGNIPGGRRRW